MTLLALTLVAGAVMVCLAPSPAVRRLTSVVARRPRIIDPADRRQRPRLGAHLLATPRGSATAAGIGGLGVAMVIGGPVGAALGASLGIGAWFWLRRISASQASQYSADDDYARTAIAAELLAAAVRAGCPTTVAVTVVGSSIGGRLGEALRTASATAQVGGAPTRAWSALTERPTWRPLGRALAAADTRGASPVRALQRVAFDARSEAKWSAESRARALGARAAAPLGLCFLPAFVLLAIVPIIVTSF